MQTDISKSCASRKSGNLSPFKWQTVSATAKDKQEKSHPEGWLGFLKPLEGPQVLLEQGQNALWRLVGLGQHGRCRLLDDLCSGQLGRGRGVVGVQNLAA